ncbi:unnamed protein product [Camellia sinensis]
MDMETDETKFEHGWTTMVEKFGLQTNSWVLETYEKCHMWAEAYMCGHFFVGMKSTQRSECMNAYFNPFLQHKLKLYEFVRHYDRALARIRYNEAGDDAETNNTFSVLITPLRDIERHGAELFTRNIFRMFRDEILEEGKLNVKDVFPLPDDQKCYYIHKYKVKDRSWIVTHSPVDAAMRCSCMKFESLGQPCCHMICVMKAENLTQIPPTCVLHRWTRAASKDGQQWPQPSIDSTTTQTARNLNGGNGDKGKHSFRRQFGVEDPDVVKTKGNPGRASSNCRRPRKCGNCKCIGHTKRTCPKVRFSRTVGTNSDADTPHITDREYNAESLPVRCKTGLVEPSTSHIKQRRLFFDVSPDSKQPMGQYGSVEAAVWKNDSNTIDEVNQSWEKTMDCHSPGQGLMPASFKVRTVPLDGDDSAAEEVLDPDFGEAAIGRVAPVDSGLWWIILLRAYGKCSGDLSVQERIDVQTGIKMILRLCLADGFDMFPTLLVTDGSCMIDRCMGIHGHPLEIQALFYSALLCAREMLAPEDGSADLIRAVNNRLVALSFHIREYYWIDMRKLNEIYRYKTEEYSYDAVNKFNIYPDQISPWLVEWMPNKGGYLIGNLQPAHMDFRFFSLGNLWSVVSSLATADQSHAILDLIEAKWADLVADMPFKICYPALEGQEWPIITGSDPKNTPWSYHNAGAWPTLLWQLTVACIKMNRPEIAAKAVEVAEKRISRDKWPEYYDTKRARFIGKQSRLFQTWSIAGYLVAKQLLADPSAAKILITEEDSELVNAFSCMVSANPRRKRGPKRPNQTYIV